MYSNWFANSLVVVGTATTVAITVLIHYEGLGWIGRWLPKISTARRRKVLFGVYGVVILHVVEIWVFGLMLWALLQVPGTGGIRGEGSSFLDAVYLSAATFSTVGFGDLAPAGAVRFLAGTEALTGFILITWSASFLYLEMQEFWKRR